ncbi:MAG TPA: carboxypeptidase-like regulatory domain-containing protein [Gemmatimonadales bacterium]|nr:carboxypeptidase-like regulatory domain-containing protein [Gemmatimonadales bacterium]
MRLRFGLLTTLLLTLGSVPALAQERVVSGTVTDSATGTPLEGATATVRGTTIGAAAGADGRLTLTNVPAGQVTITIRRIGYRAEDVVLGAGQNDLRVGLARDPLELDEVVVTGRATEVARQNAPNAVATVSGEEVTRVASQSVEHALQGKIAGAVISTNSGAPGAVCRCAYAASRRSTPNPSRFM